MRKIFYGVIAAFAAVFLASSPALAATDSVTWAPEAQDKQGSYYLESAVPQDAQNTIASALELAEIPSDANRHLYVANLPEGTNVQTAARSVAKAWELNKDSESLVLYDVTSGGTFIWPATEDNVTLAASLNGNTSVDQFSTQISTIFEGASSQDSGFPFSFTFFFFIFIGFILFIALITMYF
jgi:hypothetical protein